MKYSVSLDYPFGPHAKIMRLVTPGSDVLDVGSGQGELAKALKERKKCRVTGIDRDPTFASLSQQVCDQFFELDCEDPEIFKKIPNHYDFIIFADVLEHLVLQKISKAGHQYIQQFTWQKAMGQLEKILTEQSI